MKKTVFLLNIGNYAPEITALTYPLIRRWAKKIGAGIHIISERKFPGWDLDYEKLQIYDLGRDMGNDWNIYLDSDALIHPETPDWTEYLGRETVAHNGTDFASIRWQYDDYFRRDGRNIGSCNWNTIASSWCLDLWRPLDDLTPEQAYERIFPTVNETCAFEFKLDKEGQPERDGKGQYIQFPKAVVKGEHLVSDYALSRNIARFGLKVTTLNEVSKKLAFDQSEWYWHDYTHTIEQKYRMMRDVLVRWRLG